MCSSQDSDDCADEIEIDRYLYGKQLLISQVTTFVDYENIKEPLVQVPIADLYELQSETLLAKHIYLQPSILWHRDEHFQLLSEFTGSASASKRFISDYKVKDVPNMEFYKARKPNMLVMLMFNLGN
jgi:hypothetical protein